MSMHETGTINKGRAWLLAIRPKTLTASISPVMVGAALAYRQGPFDWVPALCCLLVALLAQISSNLFNDYYDGVRGADRSSRVGYARAVASGWIAPRVMFRVALACLSCASLFGLVLLFYGGWWLLPVGMVLALTAYAYTGGPYPLAYHGWGDLCVLLFYGIIPVCLTYYVQTLSFSWSLLLISMAMGCLSMNILIVNNYRDYEEDLAVGKRTTIVIFGRSFGRLFYLVNAFLGVALAFPFYWHRNWNIWMLFLFFLVIQLFTWQELMRLKGSALNHTLAMTARNVLLFALLLVSLLLI